jgi:phage/plasmid-associated DNA primase
MSTTKTISESEVAALGSQEQRLELATKCNKENKSLSSLQGSLGSLVRYLQQNFPGTTLIPSREGGKIPLYAHKNAQYTMDMFVTKGIMECSRGCLLILTNDIIVIDIDDNDTVEIIESSIPEFEKTVACKTNKGMHYYFKRTSECHKMVDGARQMFYANGEEIPIDIKTQTTSGTGGVISIPPSPNKKWVRELGKKTILDMPIEFCRFYEEHIKQKVVKARSNTINAEELNEVRELLYILNESRYNSYEDWIRLGWCLHNINNDYLNLWIEVSRLSSKFKEGECEKIWNTMREEGLHIGSLHMWAKQDNPSKYLDILNKRVFNDLKECNGTHNSIAAITYKILKGRYICATANSKLWYEFNGCLWKEDKEAIHLRHELSTTIRQQYLYAYHRIQRAQPVDDMQSTTSTNTRKINQETQVLLNTAMKLQDANFKDNIIKEMREYFYDGEFLTKLDSNINLLGFTNGIWDFSINKFRQSKPNDYVSLNVGYDYLQNVDEYNRKLVEEYWAKLHPIEEQRNYMIKTIARQLYGDNGNELFHIHAGYMKSAGNGKTKFWESLEAYTGDYTRKFKVQVLTTKMREEAGKPAPEYQYWKGRRILYCTEPNEDEVLHSGIMKDLTGGEKILYRLLYSNDVHDFRPQYKMHIMCNGPPRVDGADEGVRRRIRKIDYVSKFVDSEYVNESENCFKKDPTFINELKKNNVLKMEALRFLLDNFNQGYEFNMPKIIEDNSRIYLDENDSINKFIKEHIVEDKEGYFLLSEAKEVFKSKEYYNNKLNQLKNDLVKMLRTSCYEQKKIKGKNQRNVFCGYNLVYETDIED